MKTMSRRIQVGPFKSREEAEASAIPEGDEMAWWRNGSGDSWGLHGTQEAEVFEATGGWYYVKEPYSK